MCAEHSHGQKATGERLHGTMTFHVVNLIKTDHLQGGLTEMLRNNCFLRKMIYAKKYCSLFSRMDAGCITSSHYVFLFRTHLHTRYGESPQPRIQFSNSGSSSISCWFMLVHVFIIVNSHELLKSHFGMFLVVHVLLLVISIVLHHFAGWHGYMFVELLFSSGDTLHIYIYLHI